jgi:fatty acid desaturase
MMANAAAIIEQQDTPDKRSPGVRRSEFIDAKHGRVNIATIIALHVAVIAWMVAGPIALPFWAFVVITLPLCAIQQRQMSEWLHEGVHYNIHPDRKVNEFVSAWLLGAFFGLPIAAMRRAHFSHHAAENFFDKGDIDTEYAAIAPGGSIWRGFLSDLTGFTAIKAYTGSIFTRLKDSSASQENLSIFPTVKSYIPVLIVQITLLGASFFTGHLYAWILYYIALVTVYPVLSRLRLYAQHLEIDEEGHAILKGSGTTRTIDANLPERAIFMSRLMQYHWEHHEWPHLPFRALQKINEEIPDNPNRYAKSHGVVFKALAKGVKSL